MRDLFVSADGGKLCLPCLPWTRYPPILCPGYYQSSKKSLSFMWHESCGSIKTKYRAKKGTNISWKINSNLGKMMYTRWCRQNDVWCIQNDVERTYVASESINIIWTFPWTFFIKYNSEWRPYDINATDI